MSQLFSSKSLKSVFCLFAILFFVGIIAPSVFAVNGSLTINMPQGSSMGNVSVTYTSPTGSKTETCTATCTKTVVMGTQVTLRAQPVAGYGFNAWSSNPCYDLTNPVCIFQMTQYTAFETPNFVVLPPQLSVGRNGTMGSVTGGPINCGSTCTASVTAGTSITLTATPLNGYRFLGWTQGPCYGSASRTCTFSMPSSNSYVYANFGETPIEVGCETTSLGNWVDTSPIDTLITTDISAIYYQTPNVTMTINCGGSVKSRTCDWVTSCDSSCRFNSAGIYDVSIVVSGTNGAGHPVEGHCQTKVSVGPANSVCTYYKKYLFVRTGYESGTENQIIQLYTNASGGTPPYTFYWGAGVSSHDVGGSSKFWGYQQNPEVTWGISRGIQTNRLTATDSASTSRVADYEMNIIDSPCKPTADCIGTAANVGFGSNGTYTCPGGTTLETTFSKGCTENNVMKACCVSGSAPYTLSVTKTGAGDGRVFGSGIDCGSSGITNGVACSTQSKAGKSVTLVAYPDAASSFAGWSGGGCSGTDPRCITTINANTTITANFVPYNSTDGVIISGSCTPTSGTCDSSTARNYSYTESAFTGNFCSSGTKSPSSFSFPAAGSSVSWSCLGNGGGNAACTATHLGPNSCTGPDGSVIPHGTSKTYYQVASPSCTSSCVSESRTCNNGVLSGTFTSPTCTPPGACVDGNCGPAAGTYPFPASDFAGTACTTGVQSPNPIVFPAAGASAVWNCNSPNGGSNAVCSANHLGATSCTGPDGTPISHGSSRTYYSNSTEACGTSCQSELRVCNNGVLSGSFTYSTCSNTPRDGAWTLWSDWSSCSLGSQSRSRNCTNPAPGCGGVACVGSPSETQSCGSISPLDKISILSIEGEIIDGNVFLSATCTQNVRADINLFYNSSSGAGSAINALTTIDCNISPQGRSKISLLAPLSSSGLLVAQANIAPYVPNCMVCSKEKYFSITGVTVPESVPDSNWVALAGVLAAVLAIIGLRNKKH